MTKKNEKSIEKIKGRTLHNVEAQSDTIFMTFHDGTKLTINCNGTPNLAIDPFKLKIRHEPIK